MMWKEREDLRKKLKEMDELEEEEKSPFISAMPDLAHKTSP